jgi:hypothetical protein
MRYQDDASALGHYILPTSDGATLVLAWRDGAPWVLKIALDGSVLWQEMVAVFGLHSMVETEAGNFVFFGPYDILSMDSEGQLLWQRSFDRDMDLMGPMGVIISRVTHLEIDPDTGGWLIGDDFGLLSKIDSTGMLTHQTYYSDRPYYPDSLTHLSPNGISTAAQNDQGTFLIEHYGLNDDNHWRRTLGFGMHDLPVREPYFLISGDEQGGTLFGGPVYSYLIDGGVDLVLVKLDAFGAVEWQRVVAGTTSLDEVYAFLLPDGGFLVSATRWGFYAIEDEYLPYLWLIRISPDGEVLWQRIVGDGASTMHILHAAENQSGNLVLTGRITPGVNLDSYQEADLLVIQLDDAGQIPGCPWMRSVDHRVASPDIAGELDSLNGITQEEALFTWSEDLWESPLSTDAIPAPLCVDEPGAAPPTATSEPQTAVPTQSNQTYAFLNADGYVFGGVRNNQWVDAFAARQGLASGQQVSVYTNSTFSGQSTLRGRAPGAYDCGSAVQFSFDPDVDWMYSVATNGQWQVTPRRPALMDSTTPPYPTILAEVLNDLGLDDPQVQFLTLQRVDLEGDGVDEIVMTGFRQIAGSGTTVISPGDYAVVILRRLAGDEVLTIPLVSDVYPQSSSNISPLEYRVIGMLDLNADGVLEIVIQGTSPSEMVILVFDLTEPTYQPVLSLACTR